MTDRPEPVDDDLVVVKLLEDVFSTGKTPEATYTPRTGGDPDAATFDERLRDKVRRKTGGVMIFGVSKSGKTSLAERVLPESHACWLQGTRIGSIDDFWNTLAQQLSVAEKYSAQVVGEQTRSEGYKFDAGINLSSQLDSRIVMRRRNRRLTAGRTPTSSRSRWRMRSRPIHGRSSSMTSTTLPRKCGLT